MISDATSRISSNILKIILLKTISVILIFLRLLYIIFSTFEASEWMTLEFIFQILFLVASSRYFS
jgi:hypothetical protein